MKAILLGLTFLGQALTSNPSPTLQDIKPIAIPRDIGGDHPLECLLALKESHQATRAAWAPHFDSQASGVLMHGSELVLSDGDWWQDFCGVGNSPEWYECMAKRKREEIAAAEARYASERKAREALDKVDQLCGWGEL